MARALEHRSDALLGRQHDGQIVGPAILLRERACRFSSVSGATRRGVVRSKDAPAEIGGVERTRETLDHLLHEGPAGDRVVAFDICPQLGGGCPTTGCGTKAWRIFGMPWHAPVARTRRANTWVCTATLGYALLLQAHCNPTTVGLQELQSRRRGWQRLPPTRSCFASRDRRPSSALGLIIRVSTRGQMLRKPVAQLVHEGRGIVEEAIDEPDALAVEALRAVAPSACRSPWADSPADHGR